MIKIEDYKGRNDLIVYFHLNKITKEIFYVGFGGPNRAYSKCGRSLWWKRTVEKYGMIIQIVHTDLCFEKARELEISYIKTIGRRDLGLGPLINMTNGGEGSFGFKHTEETKKKLRKNKSEETKKKLSIASTNYWNNASDQIKKENQLNQKGRRNIIQKDLKGIYIKTWSSLREIERELGFFRFNVSCCLKQKQKQAYGFIWEYE